MRLHILFVEDSADDVELLLRRLKAADIEPLWDRVDTEAGLRAALEAETWELALIDYNMPGFGGPRALAVLAEMAPDVPSVTVSGAIDEDTAVATLTAGAVDYVLKDNLARLAPAVKRAAEGAELRRLHRLAAERARRALFVTDHAPLATIMVTADGTLIYANEAQAQLRGVPVDRMVGQKIWEGNPSLSPEWWRRATSAVDASGSFEEETAVIRLDGLTRVIDAIFGAIDYGGERLYIGWARDLTARRAAEQRARESETMYRRIVEMATEGIWAMDAEFRTTLVNRQMATMLGYSAGDIMGRPMTDFMFPEDVADHDREMGLRRDGFPGRYQRRFRTAGGDELWTLVQSVPEFGPGGEFRGSFGMFTDITERRRAEKALRESEERFKRFAEHTPGLMTMKDAEHRYVFISAPPTDQGAGRASPRLGCTPADVWDPDEAKHSVEVADRALKGEVVDEITEWIRDGAARYFHSLHFPIPRGAAPPLVGGLSFDVTEEHRAQEQLALQAARLRRTVEGAVLAMGHVVETRDPYTAGHERRVAELAVALAAALGLPDEEREGLRLAALIHDIGKIAVPAEILAKPGRLSPVEFNLIKQHARAGYEILAAIEFDTPVAEIVLQHHERCDGSGYPQGLRAAEILPAARILAVADVVEAMSSHRPYRAALGLPAALAEVRAGAGTRYDGAVAAACLTLVEEGGFAFTP